jgi:hypothetical protein
MRNLAVVVLVFLTVSSVRGITVSVDADGFTDADDDDTVIVADGIYAGEGNRDIDFLGKAISPYRVNFPPSHKQGRLTRFLRVFPAFSKKFEKFYKNFVTFSTNHGLYL